MNDMKKILFSALKVFVICAVFTGYTGCKFDDYELQYPYTSVLFTYQDYVRNIVVGEGLKFNAGIVLAGVVDNKSDRTVQFEIDNTLVPDYMQLEEGVSILPPAYYTLGHPSEIIVPAGQLKGYLPIEMDSVAFLSDPKSITGEYLLPIRLVASADVDSIVPDKSYVRVSVSYFGKQHAYYHYSGNFYKIMDGVVYDFKTFSYIWTENESKRFIKTVGPTKFSMVADDRNTGDPLNILTGSNVTGRVSFFINVEPAGTSATIETDAASPYDVRPSGTSSYDSDTRTFHLEYEWTIDDGTVCRVEEDLVFRNRIRDDQGNGISVIEWR